jgi:hypothetical protein
MKLTDAVKTLATTNRSLDSVAQTLIVDANEVQAALKTVEVGSVDETCLQYLAKFNPAHKPKVKKED